MRILALETSAKAASVCLWQDGELLAQSSQRGALTHSRTLLPMVEDLLKNTEIAKESVDVIAVAQGPGSFTGIRIGIATAKGLCWGLSKPVVGVSTLEALAYNLKGMPGEAILCPCMDARRNELYNALFFLQNGTITRLTPDRAISATQLAKELKVYQQPVWLFGDGFIPASSALNVMEIHYILLPENLRWQSAYGVANVAAEKAPQPAEDLLPVYLRLSQAERERQEKLNN